jgi:hypothetical protein
VSGTDDKFLNAKTIRSTNYRRLGVRLLVGFGLVMAFLWGATLQDSHWKYLSTLSVSLGGWLLIFSAVSFYRSDPEDAVFDGACGAIVGALTMALLIAGSASVGQTLVSMVSGAFLGSVVGIPLGWTLRAIRSKVVRSAPPADPAPVDLRDLWVDI